MQRVKSRMDNRSINGQVVLFILMLAFLGMIAIFCREPDGQKIVCVNNGVAALCGEEQ